MTIDPEPSTGGPPRDWADEHRVDAVLSAPQVRSALDACTAKATVGMSSEEFIGHVADAMPLKHLSRLVVRSTERGRKRALRMGFKTGKNANEDIAAPTGKVIAAVLCSLARNNQKVTSIEQYDDGCLIVADIPSDARTFGGVLQIAIRRNGTTTTLSSEATIPGQIYDWGKSKNTLATLRADIPALLIAE